MRFIMSALTGITGIVFLKGVKVMKRGILDEGSLRLVRKEFDRLKMGGKYQDYVIGEYIDSGSFARVYAVNPLNGGKKKYALRIADEKDEECVDKHKREIETVRQLMRKGQGHIVAYLMDFSVETTYGEETHVLYCTLMPFLSPLSKYKSRSDDLEIAVRLGNDLLPLLQTCMENKIIHRDIKAPNVMYDGDFRNGAGFILGDFGEARYDKDGTLTGRGTLATMAPEIVGYDKEIRHTHRLCDMYSLGLLMYYYLNGRRYPFGNEEKDHFKRLDTKGALPPPLYGSSELKALIVKATQYYPSERFSSPKEMLEALKKCEEYKSFILNSRSDEEETLNPSEMLKAQNERLRLEFAEKEKRYEQRIKELETEVNVLKRRIASMENRPVPEGLPVNPAQDQNQRGRSRRSFRVGTKVKFGQYPQSAEGVSKPLYWRVLDVRDGMALIITENLIDYRRFNDERCEITWENSTLRKWLNGDFMMTAFGSKTLNSVASVTMVDDSLPNGGLMRREPIHDQVFVLSEEEAGRYFGSDTERMARTTDYAHKLKYDNADRTDFWWLRTSCDGNRKALCVGNTGGINHAGRDVFLYNVAVRPALWLKMS